jgi:hypothetical protein
MKRLHARPWPLVQTAFGTDSAHATPSEWSISESPGVILEASTTIW